MLRPDTIEVAGDKGYVVGEAVIAVRHDFQHKPLRPCIGDEIMRITQRNNDIAVTMDNV